MNNTHRTKRAVDKATAFAKWCGKDLKYPALLFLLMTVSSMFMFRDYLFGDQLMIFNDIGSDTWQQYIMNYTAIVNDIRDGSFSLWDFSNGLGVNLFNFNLFDPFLMLLYGLGVIVGPAHMLLFINVIQIIKMLAAGLVFYWFLSQFSFSPRAKLAAAYAYGFSGFLLVWGQHYQFGTAVIYLPLLLLFCEKFIQKKRGRGFFPVMVFLCGIYSVYFTYMCLAATGLYLLFRILMAEEMTLAQRVRRFLLGCGEILLGVGMSLAVFLPMAEVILNVSSRLDSQGTGFLQWLQQCFTPYHTKVYDSMIKHLFSSNLQNGFGLAKGPQSYAMNYYEDPICFCSVLAVFLSVQFLFVLRKAQMKKRAKTVLYSAAVLIFIGVVFPVGGTVFNYFTKPTQRYTFVLIPFFLMAMAWMWDYLRKGGKLCLTLILAVTVLMGWAYLEGWKQAGFAEYKRNILILAVTGTVMAVCLVLLNFVHKQAVRQGLMAVLALALLVNVASEGVANFQARVTMKKNDTPAELMEQEMAKYEADRKSDDKETKYRAEMNKPQDFFREMYRADLGQCLDYLEQKDQSFYRVEKDYISGTVAMDASAQGYNGISSYNSVMNGYVKEFVETFCPELFFADQNHYTFWNNVEENRLAAFLGIRYLLSGQETPQEGWKLLDRVGSLYIHENEAQAGTAHFYTDAVTEESMKALCSEENRDELLESVIALPQEGEGSEKDVLKGGGNSEAENKTVKSSEDDPAYETTDLEEVSDIESVVSEQDRQVMEASEIILDAPEKDAYITGTVHAEADGYGVFMIPYEKGWSLTVDGKETELLRGDIGFLACRLPEGDYSLELKFEAPGLKAGAAGSAVFWVLFAVTRAVSQWKRYKLKVKSK